jgi:hypothetical protein
MPSVGLPLQQESQQLPLFTSSSIMCATTKLPKGQHCLLMPSPQHPTDLWCERGLTTTLTTSSDSFIELTARRKRPS